MSARITLIPPGSASIINVPPVLDNESTPLISQVLRHDQGDLLQERWKEKVARKTRVFVQRNTGLLLITTAQLFFSSMNVAVKKLNNLDPPVSPMQLIAIRMSITFVCSVLYMVATGVRDPVLGPSGVRLKLLFRGFSGFIALFSVYFSLQYLSLSDTTVLTFLAPICTVFSGAIFLGETLSHRHILVAIISIAGVVLIARPTFLFGPDANFQDPSDGNGITSTRPSPTSTERLMAVGFSLLGIFGKTGAYTTIRAIGTKAHALHSLTAFSGVCVVTSSISMIVMRMPVVIPTRLEWLSLLFYIGIFGFIAQFLLTKGFQHEKVSRGSMAIYTQMVFASIMDRIFFHTVPNPFSILGATLILASALYIALTKETHTPSPQLTTKDDPESHVTPCAEEAGRTTSEAARHQ